MLTSFPVLPVYSTSTWPVVAMPCWLADVVVVVVVVVVFLVVVVVLDVSVAVSVVVLLVSQLAFAATSWRVAALLDCSHRFANDS